MLAALLTLLPFAVLGPAGEDVDGIKPSQAAESKTPSLAQAGEEGMEPAEAGESKKAGEESIKSVEAGESKSDDAKSGKDTHINPAKSEERERKNPISKKCGEDYGDTRRNMGGIQQCNGCHRIAAKLFYSPEEDATYCGNWRTKKLLDGRAFQQRGGVITKFVAKDNTPPKDEL